jgi:hypothetical protein
MMLAPTPATAATPGAGLPPLLLPPDLRLSPKQFAQVGDANPEVVLELAADGQLIARLQTWDDEGPLGETALRRRMATSLANGAPLGWLLLPGLRLELAELWMA